MKLPRCHGCKYGPRMMPTRYNGTTVYNVEQKGFWMDSAIVGPVKSTEAEAIAAWKRMLRNMRNKP